VTFNSYAVAILFYGSETWPRNAGIAQTSNSCNKCLRDHHHGKETKDIKQSSSVMHTLQSHQPCILWHLLCSECASYTLYELPLYELTYGRTSSNPDISYFQKVHRTANIAALQSIAGQWKSAVGLWSSMLTHSHPTTVGSQLNCYMWVCTSRWAAFSLLQT